MAEQYSVVCVCVCIHIYMYIYKITFFFIHSSVDGHFGGMYLFELCFHFLWIYAQDLYCCITWQFYFKFFEELLYCFPQWLYQFTFPATVYNSSFSPHPQPSLYLQLQKIFFASVLVSLISSCCCCNFDVTMKGDGPRVFLLHNLGHSPEIRSFFFLQQLD